MSDTKYKFLDKSVLYAIEVSRKAVQQAGWSSNDVLESTWVPLVVQQIYLKTLSEYLKLAKHKLWLLQPLGNISSWVAHDLQSSGPEHSNTCSTALHAVLNGVAWLRSGMADKFWLVVVKRH
jgi:3-oxoacyl-(acyl-carrier-protein) synthase